MRTEGRIRVIRSSALFASPLLFLAAMLPAQTTTTAPCTVAVATPCAVSGKLTTRHVYGPPWFGEKKGDTPRFTLFVIQLRAPVHIACVRDHASDPVEDCGTTTALQVYPKEKIAPESVLRSLIGAEVIATGTTSEPVAPMDQTPGTMDLTSLEPHRMHLEISRPNSTANYCFSCPVPQAPTPVKFNHGKGAHPRHPSRV
jgi:hypothetical protein